METYDLYPDIALELSKLSPEQVDAVRAYLQELGASGAGQEEHKANYLTGIAKRETVILLVNPDNLFTAHDFNSILDLSARQS